MHIREIKIINGIPTIISRHQTDTHLLIWNGEKWVLDASYAMSVSQMLRSIIKKED